MNNKRNKIALIVAIFGLFSLIAGSSYAIFTTNINEEGIQLVTVGNVNIEINEKSNGLNLAGISTMDDVSGYLQNNYYEFTVKNTSSTSVQYTVTLVDDTNALNNYNGNIIDDEFIKIGPEINNKKTGAYNIAEINRIVYEGYLLENGTATFKLRFWLNNEKEAELNSMTGYSKFLKVKVSATQQISEDKYAKANAPLMNVKTANYDKYVEITGLDIPDYESPEFTGYYKDVPIDVTLEEGKTYMIKYNATSNVSPFYLSVGCGDTMYKRDIFYTPQNETGDTQTIVFTPTSYHLSVGTKLFLRPVRYSTSTTFTYSYSNIKVYEKLDLKNGEQNMIPVKFDEQTHAWYKADIDNKNNDWYDYEGSIWANAATVNETTTKTKLVNIDGTEINCTNTCTRDDYLNAPIGTYIPLDDINSMWVWIPRFKYQIFNANEDGTNGVEPQQIKVYFEEGTSNTGTVECIKSLGTYQSEICTDKKYGTVTNGLSTYTHPAFTFGDTELTGIWMAKFEPSLNATNNNIEILPNKTSLSNKRIDEFFQISREMELISNPYGFASNATEYTATGELIGDDNNIDIHISRNMDWGAAAYLSQSRYGRCHNDSCDDIYYNNSNYYTGASGGAPSTKLKTLEEQYPDGTSLPSDADVSKSTSEGYYSYDGKRNAYYGYTEEYMDDLSLGYGASTTGNVYGIYDMAGGSNDYVMTNAKYSSSNSSEFNVKSATSWSETIHPLSKYYDEYAYVQYWYGVTSKKASLLGDAIRETTIDPTIQYKSGWYTNAVLRPTYSYPYINRGGYTSSFWSKENFNSMGLFSSYYASGGAGSNLSMRLTLTIE